MVALVLLIGALFLWATTAAATPRVRPVALETTDPFVGLWQRGSSIVDVLASGEARIVSDPVACRVGEVQSKDFVKVADGSYTVSNGQFAPDACTAASFTPGFGLQVTGDTLTPGTGGSSWTRLPATALAPTDPILGQWQNPGGSLVNEVRPDGSVRIVKGPQCRLGQLDSYDVKPTAPGTYSVRNGVFAPGACTAKSFSAEFTLTLGADGLRPGGGTGSPWTKVVPSPPATADTDSLHIINYNVGGVWVGVALLAKDKDEKVQEFISALGIAQPGLYGMKQPEAAQLDNLFLQTKAENDAVEDLIKPLTDTVDAAAQGAPGVPMPVALDDDVAKTFRIVVMRRV